MTPSIFFLLCAVSATVIIVRTFRSRSEWTPPRDGVGEAASDSDRLPSEPDVHSAWEEENAKLEKAVEESKRLGTENDPMTGWRL